MVAIEAEGLGKRYRLGDTALESTTLRDALVGWIGSRQRDTTEELWALRDVSFSVAEGEAVGIVGANGAGKSTLLKILARITDPTTGRALVRGRLGALLEVGTAFHEELTGRENIFINGAILGMSRGEIHRRFDEIVDFAGIERFLDTPLKRYSSGMYLRLAFAVAAHFEPDVVVVDEVLAVGDAEFQRKCLGKMSELGGQGRTVLFVSHDLGAITALCPRSIWIENGHVREDGPSAEVIAAYLSAGVDRSFHVELEPRPADPAEVAAVRVLDEQGAPAAGLRRGEPLTIAARVRVREPTPGLDMAISLTDASGVTILDELWSDQAPDGARLGLPGEREVRLSLPALLPAGGYVVSIWFGVGEDPFVWEEVLQLELLPRPEDSEESIRRRRAVQPPLRWTLHEP
jgi:ABC-2 type transport system ATP-binding protein/lipopolysaccharide transport system ATP-binding protein